MHISSSAPDQMPSHPMMAWGLVALLLCKSIASPTSSLWGYSCWALVNLQLLLILAWIYAGRTALYKRIWLGCVMLFLLADIESIVSPDGVLGMLRGDWELAMTNRRTPFTYIYVPMYFLVWMVPGCFAFRRATKNSLTFRVRDLLWMTLLMATVLSLYSRMYRAVHGGLLPYFLDWSAEIVDAYAGDWNQLLRDALWVVGPYSLSALVGVAFGIGREKSLKTILLAGLAVAITVGIPYLWATLGRRSVELPEFDSALLVSSCVDVVSYITASCLFAAVSRGRVQFRWKKS